jgi:pimeloyl-ACP methyl ester carboxylesterase
VNRVKLYHEVYGQGEPLVLLHGGLMTIGEMRTLHEPFAKTHKAIAVELQGHGRTADTDARSRPWATTLLRCSANSPFLRPTSWAFPSAPLSACAPRSSTQKKCAG